MRNSLYIRYFVTLGLSIIGVILIWLGVLSSRFFMWIGFGIAAIGVILSWTIRCPGCGHSLMGKRQLLLPNFCPNCGKAICDEETEE